MPDIEYFFSRGEVKNGFFVGELGRFTEEESVAIANRCFVQALSVNPAGAMSLYASLLVPVMSQKRLSALIKFEFQMLLEQGMIEMAYTLIAATGFIPITDLHSKPYIDSAKRGFLKVLDGSTDNMNDYLETMKLYNRFINTSGK